MERIVLAYSGGLDTSVAIPWLAEKYRAEVVAVTMDLGQGRELDDVHDRALAIGAVRSHVIDLRDEFARDFILPALQADAMYDGRYPLSTPLGRPLIAKHLVEIAHIEGASAIAHGCVGKDPDAARLESSVRALDPALKILAPARSSGLTRVEAIEYAKQRGIPVPPTADSPYSTDRNLWGRSVDCGAMDDLWEEPPDEIYQLTKSPAETPDTPAYVEIAFEQGVPASINGVEMAMAELIQSLQTIAGAHGIGRAVLLDHRLAGASSREIVEAPAAVALHAAHRDLQHVVIPRDLQRLTAELGATYADLVYNGQWFTPMREAIDALVAQVQEKVTGIIRLKFHKGDCRVAGYQSPHARRDAPTRPVKVRHPLP